MAIILKENQKLNLTKYLQDLKSIEIQIDWKGEKDIVLDFSAFMLNINKKVLTDCDLISIGNLKGIDNSVELLPIEKKLNQSKMKINFDKIPENYFEINFVLSIYKSVEKSHYLKDIHNLKINILHENNLIARYIPNINSINSFDSLNFGNLSKRNNSWFFNSENKELNGGLKSFCDIYDIK